MKYPPTFDVGPNPIRQFVFSIRETPNGCSVTVVTPKRTKTKRFIKKGAVARAKNWIREQRAAILEMVKVEGLPTPDIIVPMGMVAEPIKQMAGDQLRAAFEKWADEPCTGLGLARFPDDHMYAGQYIDQETHAAWQAWRRSHYDTLGDVAKLREVLIGLTQS